MNERETIAFVLGFLGFTIKHSNALQITFERDDILMITNRLNAVMYNIPAVNFDQYQELRKKEGPLCQD